MSVEYEWLRVRNVFDDDFIYDEKGDYISWEGSIPEGWYIAFGREMIKELNKILVKYDLVEKYRIIQIKEKYGSLRWYDNGVSEDAYIDYRKWLDKYEKLSKKICIKCGRNATHFSEGWVLPLCNECKI